MPDKDVKQLKEDIEQVLPDEENQPPQHPIDLLKQMAEDAKGSIDAIGILGSAFATMSMPLPKDHWLYETDEYGGCGEPPMPILMGQDHPQRGEMEIILTQAAKYAIRASTECGKVIDFSPDAMVRNFIIGVVGYYTPDGLSHADEVLEEEDYE